MNTKDELEPLAVDTEATGVPTTVVSKTNVKLAVLVVEGVPTLGSVGVPCGEVVSAATGLPTLLKVSMTV